MNIRKKITKKRRSIKSWKSLLSDKQELISALYDYDLDDQQLLAIKRFERLDLWKQDILLLYARLGSAEKVGETIGVTGATIRNYIKAIKKEIQ